VAVENDASAVKGAKLRNVKRGGGSIKHNPARAQRNDPVCKRNGLCEIMRREQQRETLAAHEIQEKSHHLLPRGGVKTGDWFIRKHQARALHQRACDGDPLGLATRKPICTAGGNIAKTYAIETSHRLRPQILWCQGLKPGARKICPSNRTMEHIAQGRKATDKVMLLENETDVGTQAAERGTIHAAHFTPQELDVAGIGFDQPKAAS
jgi:hypothetical protein